MLKMELTKTNQEFAAAAADMIELRGKASGQYEDKYSGACCALGALRYLTFGHLMIHTRLHPSESKMKRYFDLVDWLAEQVKEPGEESNTNTETIVGQWSDGHPQKVVVEKLREMGRPTDVLEPQA